MQRGEKFAARHKPREVNAAARAIGPGDGDSVISVRDRICNLIKHDLTYDLTRRLAATSKLPVQLQLILVLSSPLFNIPNIAPPYPAFAGQKLRITYRELGRKIRRKHVEMWRIVIVSKTHHIEYADASYGRHGGRIHITLPKRHHYYIKSSQHRHP